MYIWDQDAAGSSPVTSTKGKRPFTGLFSLAGDGLEADR